MRKRWSILSLTLAGMLTLSIAATGDQSQPAAAKMPAPATKPTTVGKPESAKWTATTLEAATTAAQKEVLEHGKPAAVTGEVVDVSCYLQLGKRGEAHVACGSKCIANGQPIGLLDDEDHLYLLMVEEHHPRRDGKLELESVFAPLLAKTVTVNGMVMEMKGYRALFVQATALDSIVKSAPRGSEK